MPRRPGTPKTGGRKKGTPNRLTASVKEAILKAFDDVGGPAYLVQVAESDPRTFCSLLGRILPNDIRSELTTSVEAQPRQEMSHLEIARRIIFSLRLGEEKLKQMECSELAKLLKAENTIVDKAITPGEPFMGRDEL